MNKFTGNKKQRWDWTALKVEFFTSSFNEVKAFFQHKYGTFNSTVKHRTIGWSQEKKSFQIAIATRALEDLTDKHGLEIAEGLWTTTKHLMVLVRNPEKMDKLSIREMKLLWEIFRTENGLPIKITDKNKTSFPQNLVPKNLSNRALLLLKKHE